MHIRAAVIDDAAAIGALHARSWAETYAGLLPDQMITDASATARAAMWHAVLADRAAHAGASVFVAEQNGFLVGFSACGDQRDDALAAGGFDGEIGAVYVLRAAQHEGIGRAIVARMAGDLRDRGRSTATLWVLRQNDPARHFYERLGGLVVGERRERYADAWIEEVAYGWTDLTILSGGRL